MEVYATYILVAVHAERLNLLDNSAIVIVGLRLAVGGRGKLIGLVADGLKELIGSGAAGLRVFFYGRHFA